MDIQTRLDRAEQVLAIYQDKDTREAITELLVDMRHYCEHHMPNFEVSLNESQAIFDNEMEDDRLNDEWDRDGLIDCDHEDGW